jgi:hypothetical protein
MKDRRFEIGAFPFSFVAAEPEIPRDLNDRAADIWQPLFVIADLAGGSWAGARRDASRGDRAASTKTNPMVLLLFNIVIHFARAAADRMFSSELVQRLPTWPGRPWNELLRGKAIDEYKS